uniref:PH domain-containing protein n=1 Tax=Meloidogyne hapla TaxID=6305 RepID=A0A1I8BA98_MELHA
MHVRCPSLPPGFTIHNLVGIRVNPKASKVHWILFPSEKILNEWITDINSTLPQRQNPPRNASRLCRFCRLFLNIVQLLRLFLCIIDNCDDGGDDGGGGCFGCGGDEEDDDS